MKSKFSTSSSIRDDDNPYVGPRAFGEADPLYGRDRELREISDLLVAERIVVLHSPSGAGKTSLIHAEDGLLRELKRMGFTTLPPVRVNLQPPGKTPADAGRYAYSIMASLESARKTKVLLTREQLASMTLEKYLAQALPRISTENESTAPVVLILDQFEEVFTLDPTDAMGRQQFFSNLGDLLNENPIWMLFAMRGDLLGELEGVAHLIPGDLAVRYRLGLLERSAARKAIVEPAWRRHEVTFTPEAADRLLDNLCTILVKSQGNDPQARPSPYVEGVILQTVLLKLWQRLDPLGSGEKVIKPDHLGNLLNHVDRALASHYRDSVGQASQTSLIPERTIRDWFENQLITTQGWRNPADKGPGKGSGRRTNKCLEVLEAQHIIRSETRLNRQWWEIVHDRFLNPVKDDNSRWRRARDLDAIPAAAQQWSQDKKDDHLLHADQIVAAAAWLQEHENDSYEIERQFIAESERVARKAKHSSTVPHLELDPDLLQSYEHRLSEQYLIARHAYNVWWYVSLGLAILVLVLGALLAWQLS